MHETMTRDIANLDFSTIAALQQKRTLAFVNHFILTTVQFLNNFAKKCEQKLIRFERKLEKVEAAMVLLEARLSSIPEINTTNETENSKESTSVECKEPLVIETLKEESVDTPDMQRLTYPEYDKFVKMVQVGVPLPAVKLKASTEGLDPNILDQILNK